MKCLKFLFLSVLILPLALSIAVAQSPTRVKRPVKNPPQYPNIIDLENKDSQTARKDEQDEAEKDRQKESAAQTEALIRAVETLALEMRSLVQEVRAMNVRQQAQLDVARISGFATRIDSLNSDLRAIRDRLGSLSVDEQNINQLMTRESLLAQSFNIGTLDRERTMEQIRQNHEAKLRYVQAEKERLQRTENELLGQVQYYQNLQQEAEKRIQTSEEQIRKLETSRENPKP